MSAVEIVIAATAGVFVVAGFLLYRRFFGNSILALFGDPAPHQDHALRAVRTALDMQNEMEALQKRWIAEGKSGLQVRIGIATGEAYVGNASSPGFIEYVVIGQVIDLAARLESKATPGGILISEETYQEVKDIFQCVGVPGLVLRDHQKPYQSYRVEPSRGPSARRAKPANGPRTGASAGGLSW